jgi:transcriptional regulator with XRE-family HTH domain
MMGELKKRQRVRGVQFQGFDAQNDSIKIKGMNLDDVVKGIILDYKNHKGWSTREMARRCGLRQQTLTTYLNDSNENGGRIAILTHLCAGLGLDPVELFLLHPDIETQEGDGYWQNKLQRQVNTANVSQAMKEKLEEIVILSTHLDCFNIVVEQSLALVRSMASAQKVDLKKARKSALI